MMLRIGRTLFVCLICLLSYTVGLETYIFQEGTSAVFTFIHVLQGNDTRYDVELHSDEGYPFYTNGSLVPSQLKPDQQSRFQVNVTQSQNQVTAKVSISQVKTTDAGFYVMLLREYFDEGPKDVLYHASVEVAPSSSPPDRGSKAECDVSHMSNAGHQDEDLFQVLCSATATEDGRVIACFQNLNALPPAQPENTTHNKVVAVFLASRGSPISCCLVRAYVTEDSDLCVDYVYTFATSPSITVTLSHVNKDVQSTSQLPNQDNDRYTHTISSGEIGVLVLVAVLVSIILAMAFKDTVIDFYRDEKWKRRENRKATAKMHGVGDGYHPRRDLTIEMKSLVDDQEGEDCEIDEKQLVPDDEGSHT